MHQDQRFRLNWMDDLRGLAALLVLFGHARLLFPISDAGGPLLDIFPRGVQLFYILSGFILFRIYSTRILVGSEYTKFLVKRFFRIAPAFYIIMIICILINTSTNVSSLNIILHFLILPFGFIPNFVNSIIGVEWSIFVEGWFYVIFPLVVFSFVRFPISTIISSVLISVIQTVYLVVMNVDIQEKTYYYNLPTAQICFFVVGMWLASLENCGKNKYAIFAFLSGFLSFGLIPFALDKFTFQIYLSLISFALLIYGYSGLRRGEGDNVLSWIGHRSYSIYLIHFPCILLIKRTEIVSNRPGLACVGVVLLTIILSDLSYRIIELPGIKLGEHLLRRVWFVQRTA